MEKVKAELEIDSQHGPVVRVTIEGIAVSVYLMDETGIATMPDNRQAGIEVTGPWHEFKQVNFATPTEIDDEEVKECCDWIDSLSYCSQEMHDMQNRVIAALTRLHHQTREDREEIEGWKSYATQQDNSLVEQDAALKLVERQRDALFITLELLASWMHDKAFAAEAPNPLTPLMVQQANFLQGEINRIRALSEENNND